MIKRNYIIFFLFLLILYSFSFRVSAVAIGGAVYEELIFQPGLEKIFNYVAISNTDKVMDHTISVGGDLGPYFTLSTDVLKDLAPNEQGIFTAHMKLPQELKPGWHSAYICVGETETRGASGGGTSIGTRVVGCALIKVLSLYAEPLIIFELKAPNIAQNEIVNFILDVTSLSKQDMLIEGTVDIYTKESPDKIITVYTNKKLL